MPPPAVLLSASPQAPADDLRRLLTAGGFAVADHLLGAAPPVDFAPVVAAVVETGERIDAAAAQTRRWRAELADGHVPVLWVLPFASHELTVRALGAGADAVLARPVDAGVFEAQVRAMARARSAFARQAVKAAEARLLGDQLQKAYGQLDRELEMARRVHRAFLPQSFPRAGAARFAVCYRPRSRVGGDFYDVQRLDEDHVGFALADVTAHGSAAGSLLGVFVKRSLVAKDVTDTGYRLLPPDEVLGRVNRELLGLNLDDPPLVALLYGRVNVRSGAVAFARAGLPPPLLVPAAGDPEPWHAPGPMLGAFDATFGVGHGTLAPGDRLLLGTDGTRPEAEPGAMLQVALGHRHLAGQAFVDAVARDLIVRVGRPDDFTLLCVEMTADPA